jgi:hypothetical protein
MMDPKAIETRARRVAARNGLRVEKARASKSQKGGYTVSKKDCVVFSADSVDDVDYFLKLLTARMVRRNVKGGPKS